MRQSGPAFFTLNTRISFIENLNAFLGKDIAFTRLLLPVGISFFTFQQIAWLVDSFCMETGDYSFWDYFLFTVYFPKIAMGPILLHGEFMPQLKDPSRLKADSRNMAEGLMILAVGLFKKVILAEFFAGPVNLGVCPGWRYLSSTDGVSGSCWLTPSSCILISAVTVTWPWEFPGCSTWNCPLILILLTKRCLRWNFGSAGT